MRHSLFSVLKIRFKILHFFKKNYMTRNEHKKTMEQRDVTNCFNNIQQKLICLKKNSKSIGEKKKNVEEIILR